MREIWALCRKDLQIEARSKVVATQVVPFAMVILILFGLALDADSRTLRDLAPGLFWVATLFASILAGLDVNPHDDNYDGDRPIPLIEEGGSQVDALFA